MSCHTLAYHLSHRPGASGCTSRRNTWSRQTFSGCSARVSTCTPSLSCPSCARKSSLSPAFSLAGVRILALRLAVFEFDVNLVVGVIFISLLVRGV